MSGTPSESGDPPSRFSRGESGDERSADIDAERLCAAATSVFFAIVREQSVREGRPIPVPLLMCPRRAGPATCPCEFSRQEILEAEAFLLRLGMIERHAGKRP